MNLFPPNNILEEEIFTPRNLGPDCDIIGGLLERFGNKFILSALEDGEWHTVRALESGSVILEMKEGAYEPIGEEDVLR